MGPDHKEHNMYLKSLTVSLSILAIPVAIAASTHAAPVEAARPTYTTPAIQSFDQAAFDKAQRDEKPILVWVYAPWCPVCRQQAKTIERVIDNEAYQGMKIFRIDYDTQRALWSKFGATMQSTLIGFHGRKETGRVAHETDDLKISAVIRSTLM